MPRTTLLRKQVTPTGTIQPHAGGAGPVADFETMKIVNEYNGQFEIVFEEE